MDEQFAGQWEGEATWVVRASGEIDIASADALAAAIDDGIGNGAGRVVVDMSAVQFLDSSGLAVLVAAASKAEVSLRDASPAVRRVIEVSGLAPTLGSAP